MKKRLLVSLLFCILLVTSQRFSSLSSAGMGAPAGSGAAAVAGEHEADADSELNARIARIENGLLPAVVVEGESTPPMTLVARMEHYKVNGLSIAFFDHGQIVWTRTYGISDVGTKKPVKTDTLFQAASISKPVSALATLKLVQDGALNLDEDVNVKLRTWKVPENDYTRQQKVTLREILSHSAGLTVHGFPGYAAGEPIPTMVQILDGQKPANTPPIRVDILPGTIFRYSGGGYVVLQALLADVTGKPFPQLLHDLVLEPAGMTHSTYQQPLPENLRSMAATPYRSNGEPVTGGWHTYPEMAPAGLWTTPSDLARMAIEVQNEYAGKSSRILSQKMVREMLTPVKDDYGMGFGLGPVGHPLRFGHGGANEGFQCNVQAYAESGQGVAMMTNSDSGGQLIGEILRAVSREYHWPDFQSKVYKQVAVDPTIFDKFTGKYQLEPSFILTVTHEGEKLMVQATGQPEFQILPESDQKFFARDFELEITFQTDSTGRAVTLIVHQGGEDHRAKRID